MLGQIIKYYLTIDFYVGLRGNVFGQDKNPHCLEINVMSLY